MRFSKRGLWSLFLISAFPVHLWTMILVFRDFSWVAERTNAWDAIGVGAYGLVLAFLESAVVFLITLLLAFLVPRHWNEDRRITVLSVLILATGLWAIAGQIYFLLDLAVPNAVIKFLSESHHPLRVLYAGLLVLILSTVLIPVYLILRSEKLLQYFQEFISRLSLLAAIYLLFDIVGLLIVIIRNL